jgi:hypothetical protein
MPISVAVPPERRAEKLFSADGDDAAGAGDLRRIDRRQADAAGAEDGHRGAGQNGGFHRDLLARSRAARARLS